jgi:hypothetical protein
MISSIYQSIDSTVPQKVRDRIESAIETHLQNNPLVKLFFRADDIAVQSDNFQKMMDLFVKYQLPLCLAVVPAWLTGARWEAMAAYRQYQDLFCWHMHGYRHKNYEVAGKKQEFGPNRRREEIQTDLENGFEKLSTIMGPAFTPYFTPPWNRCTYGTMEILSETGFAGISRSMGSTPEPPASLKEVSVHVDLHTRKDRTAEMGWEKLIKELETGLSSGQCGIMLHHMRMDEAAFVFLDYFLNRLKSYEKIEFFSFSDLT